MIFAHQIALDLTQDQEAYCRLHHPHPWVQRKMEALSPCAIAFESVSIRGHAGQPLALWRGWGVGLRRRSPGGAQGVHSRRCCGKRAFEIPIHGAAFILLGADLEESGHPDTGWSVIVGSRTYPPGKASIFKVPHHGSHTGHHPQVWQDMLDTAPFAILTPFALGNVSLPTPQDVERICQRTEQAYATAIPRPRRPRGRPQAVEKLIRDTVGSSIREVYSSTGHIRLRANLAETPLSWRVELFGDACPLRNIYR